MGLPHPPADPRYASTYCGLKKLSASLPGGDYVPCSSQTRRFGVHVAKSPAELVQALLANVDTRGDYCGAKGPRGKVVAPNEARCASTRQLRKWGVLPTRGGYGVADDLAYGSNVMAGGNVDAALIPDMITRNHATLIHRALPVLRQPFHNTPRDRRQRWPPTKRARGYPKQEDEEPLERPVPTCPTPRDDEARRGHRQSVGPHAHGLETQLPCVGQPTLPRNVPRRLLVTHPPGREPR